MRQDNDYTWLRTRRWEEFCQSLVNHTLSLAERISECASGWCEGKCFPGSYSFVHPSNWTVGKLLLDPNNPRLLVGFRADIPEALRFAQRLGYPIEHYRIMGKPFLMVQAHPVREADEICETMTDFLREACEWAPQEGQVNGQRGEDASLSKALEVAVSQSSINGLQVVADALQLFREHNKSLMAEITRVATATAHDMLTKSMARSLAITADFFKSINAQVVLPDISKAIRSPAYEALYSANLSISNLFDTTSAIAKPFAQLAFVSEMWQSQLQSVGSVLGAAQYSKIVLDSHLAQILERSVLAQASLHQLRWDRIGSALQIGAHVRNTIQSSFLDFTQAYSGLFGSLEKQPVNIVSLPPFASELPAVELFNETNLLESITIRDTKVIESVEQKQQIQQEIRGETGDRLVVLLEGLGGALVPLWEGATFSLKSDHPDHARHFCTSLRELFTHVLHALAPSGEVEKWTSNPAHYHNKRPTRKARLLYICRGINQGPFTKFLETDIRATLAFLDLFQGGTHKTVASYTIDQLTAMLVRMESALRFMLEIRQGGKWLIPLRPIRETRGFLRGIDTTVEREPDRV